MSKDKKDQNRRHEYEIAMIWCRQNKMIVNPGKFQSMITEKTKITNKKYKFNIDNMLIETLSVVKILRETVDN